MEKKIREEIIAYGRLLYAQGLVSGASGNISARLDRQHILVTPSGCHKGLLKATDLVVFNTETNQVVSEGSAKPSSEFRMHTYIYAQQPKVEAVIHAHPPYAVALSVAGVALEKVILPETVLSLGYIANCGYATPTTNDVVEAIKVPVQSGATALILARHGSVTIGNSLHEAFCRLETVEHLAKVISIAGSLGEIDSLTTDQIEKLQKISASHQRSS